MRSSVRESITIASLPGFTSFKTHSGNLRGISEFQPRISFSSTSLLKLSPAGNIWVGPVDTKTESAEQVLRNCLRISAGDEEDGQTSRMKSLSSPPDISLDIILGRKYLTLL